VSNAVDLETEVLIELVQQHRMMPGDHQDMTGVDRLVVHECNDLGILIDHAPLQLATDESAERATVIDLDRHNHSLSAQYWSLLEVPRFHWSVRLRARRVPARPPASDEAAREWSASEQCSVGLPPRSVSPVATCAPLVRRPYNRIPPPEGRARASVLSSAGRNHRPRVSGYDRRRVLRLRGDRAVLETPRHVHRNEDEMCYVVEGEHIYQCGDEEFQVGPGGRVFCLAAYRMPTAEWYCKAGRLLFMNVLARRRGVLPHARRGKPVWRPRRGTYARASHDYGINCIE
jgi:hypothetical protein